MKEMSIEILDESGDIFCRLMTIDPIIQLLLSGGATIRATRPLPPRYNMLRDIRKRKEKSRRMWKEYSRRRRAKAVSQ